MSNCKKYNLEKCPKAKTIQVPYFSLQDFKVAIVGCWGVYCQNGKVRITSYSENDKLALKDPSKLTPRDFLETEDSTRGQGAVVKKMIDTFPDGLTSLFLAGDNIYEYSEVSPKLLEDLEQRIGEWRKRYLKINSEDKEALTDTFKEIFLSKKDIKKNRGYLRTIYKNLFINLQLSRGFIDCFRELDVQDIFLAFGNHDIETCDIFNYQLNFEKGKYAPATYYNVVYGDLLNVFVLDTNLYEPDGKDCNGKDISEEDIKLQTEWFADTISKSECRYNIVIGHIPYKASGHKGKVIYNKTLKPVFDIISRMNKEKILVQAYFCADEHNQQLLFDKESNIYLVVVGSGGTELDVIKPISEDEYSKIGVEKILDRVQFGFSYLEYNQEKENMELNIVSVDGEENKFNLKRE